MIAIIFKVNRKVSYLLLKNRMPSVKDFSLPSKLLPVCWGKKKLLLFEFILFKQQFYILFIFF